MTGNCWVKTICSQLSALFKLPFGAEVRPHSGHGLRCHKPRSDLQLKLSLSVGSWHPRGSTLEISQPGFQLSRNSLRFHAKTSLAAWLGRETSLERKLRLHVSSQVLTSQGLRNL